MGLKGLSIGVLDPNPPTLSLPSLLLVKPAVVVEVVFMVLIILLSFLPMTDVLRGFWETTEATMGDVVERPKVEPVLLRGPGPGAIETGEEAVSADAAMGVPDASWLASDSCHCKWRMTDLVAHCKRNG